MEEVKINIDLLYHIITVAGLASCIENLSPYETGLINRVTEEITNMISVEENKSTSSNEQ